MTWGGQFVVGKSALDRVNAFPLSTVRYAAAAGLWLLVLAVVEGRHALNPGRQGLRLFWLGSLGFAGFNLLAYTGLAHSRPQSASLIVALAPLLTALVLWRRTGRRPSNVTFAFLALALGGVALVISGGHPSTIVNGSIGWGDAPLVDTLPQIAYLALPGAFIAVLTWNAAIGMIGPQNAVLFGNLIPVTTFAIEIVRGYRPGVVELAGAGLTLTALVANNLVSRRPGAVVEKRYELLEAA